MLRPTFAMEQTSVSAGPESAATPHRPLFNWLDHRAAGVVLHPTAMPGRFGIGVFDEAALNLLRFFAEADIRYWQLCPLGPTGFGDSPYQCFSSFAGNPYLIDPVPLVRAGLLQDAQLDPLRALPADRVDYGGLYQRKWPLLFAAHEAWRRDPGRPLPYGDFQTFRHENAGWLESYSLFSALKDRYEGRPWWEWPAGVRSFSAAQQSGAAREVAARAEGYAFIQFLFFGQWSHLRRAAAALGIQIVGDTPIFTARDSADVWANPELFQLDRRTLQPTRVAGVPPDYFSADGQLWGNPLYEWDAHASDDYAWWLRRLRANFALYDIVRIDHFRGFESYWSIPAGAESARKGRWETGPGLAFFQTVRDAMPDAKLVAEDLGDLNPGVFALRDATGLPGMSVLQFAFGGGADNYYLPHNHRANSIVYPGTHDNDTTLGWYRQVDEKIRDHVRRYFRISGQQISWDLIRASYASVASLAVIPLQDFMSLGSEARFNLPGNSQGNWNWRYRADQLDALRQGSAAYLRELAALYGRTGTPPSTAADPAAGA
jgi:4-alpha-glucanotransferase